MTDAQGRFHLDGVPAGTRVLRLQHADGALEKRVTVEVSPGGTTEVEIALGEDGG